MPAPPRDQLDHIVVGDLGQQLVLAKMLDQVADLPFGIVSPGVMLADFMPVATGQVVEPQRRCRGTHLGNMPLGLLAFGTYYRFRFAAGRAFRRAEKAMTSDLEVEAPVGRTRVLEDGHGESFRVCAAMNSL